MLLAVDGRAYTITVDGSAADWVLAPQPTINNIGQIARDTSNRGVFAWKDLANDYTTYVDSDLTYFYATADATYLYFLVRMQNITVAGGLGSPAVQIAIDRSAGGSTAFCLLDTPITTSASAAYEYIVFAWGGANELRVGSVCGTALAGNMSISVANDVIEMRVPWANIGGVPAATGSKLRFTVLAGRTKDNGQPASVEFNTDTISNCGHPGTAGCTTASELANAVVDYYFDVWFRLGSGTDYEPYPPLVISEVDPDPGYADSTREWVEIFNTSNTNLTLTGFRIGDEETLGSTEGMYSFPAGAAINNGNAQVVAVNGTGFYNRFTRNAKYELTSTRPEAADMTRDATWSSGTMSLADAGDEVLLLDDRFTIIDAVVYGPTGWSNVSAISAPLATQSLERTRVYRDTDNCTNDFGLGGPTPNVPQASCVDAAGNALPAPPARSCSTGDPCLIETCTAAVCGSPTARTCAADGNECTQDLCDGNYGGCYPPQPTSFGCTDTASGDCNDARCNGAGACVQSGIAFENSSYACTDTVANDCWTARCSGTTATCVQSGSPAVPIAANTQCTDTNTADCYDARCDGSTGCLQNYGVELPSYSCRAAAGVCDLADNCDGVTGGCADAKVGGGTACTSDGNACTLDQCDGVSNACQHPAGNAGATCNASTGECDPAELCNGSSTTCPGNVFTPNGTACTSDGNPCSLDQCNGGSGACQHPAGNGGTICNASTGVCDPAETCTGSSTACPPNAFSPAGTACTSDGNPCTVDQCNGSLAACQHPAGNAGTVCLAAAGECDLAESCTGSSTACPADTKRTSGTACTADSNPCTLDQCDGSNNGCQHPAGNAGAVCLGAAGECDLAETCTGSSTTCPADGKKGSGTPCTADANVCTLDQCDGTNNTCQHPAGNAGTVCRAAPDECDLAETCTGSSTTCPADAKKGAGTACTTDNNPCTIDQCDGASTLCQHPPGNAGTECRASTGVCDPRETCSGASATCPGDAKSGAGTSCTSDGNPCSLDECDGTSAFCQHPAGNAGAECRASAGACDPRETCTGSSTGCPIDAKSTAECRAAAGECDVAETCDGSNNSCPGDAKHASGFACTADSNSCTADECNGASDACQHPAGNQGAVCRAAVVGGCDVAEHCDGTATCPADVVVAFATPCLDEGNACTLDLCNGTSPACQHPTGNVGSVCRPAASICDQPEYCDGTDICPTDIVLSSSALCRGSVGPCDMDDFCDGVHGECVDTVQPSTVECRTSTGVCDPTENCDGTSGVCPTDVKSVDVCRAAAGFCDAPEFCDGNNGDCPADVKLGSAITCRAVAGECDRAEICDGVNNDCPVDGKRTDVCRLAVGTCDLAESCDGMSNSCPADQLAPATTTCDDQNPCTSGTHCDGLGHCIATTIACDGGAGDGGTLDALGADVVGFDARTRPDAQTAAPIDSPTGCGCAVTGAARGPLGALLLLGGLFALRRRSGRG